MPKNPRQPKKAATLTDPLCEECGHLASKHLVPDAHEFDLLGWCTYRHTFKHLECGCRNTAAECGYVAPP